MLGILSDACVCGVQVKEDDEGELARQQSTRLA